MEEGRLSARDHDDDLDEGLDSGEIITAMGRVGDSSRVVFRGLRRLCRLEDFVGLKGWLLGWHVPSHMAVGALAQLLEAAMQGFDPYSVVSGVGDGGHGELMGVEAYLGFDLGNGIEESDGDFDSI